MNKFDNTWWDSVEEALAIGQRITGTSEELNQACDHIVQLLTDASLLLEAGSHATATFLAITALEETAKIHVGMFRKSSEPAPRGKDPLFKHHKKHHIAAAPTIARGSRLQETIAESRMQELIELARSGGLIRIREASLYVEKRDGQLRVPSAVVTKDQARELIIFAVEAFDDTFVGYTNHSYELGKLTDQIFARWKRCVTRGSS